MSGKQTKRARRALRASGGVPEVDAKRNRDRAAYQQAETRREARRAEEKYRADLFADASPERDAEREEVRERMRAEEARRRAAANKVAQLLGVVSAAASMFSAPYGMGPERIALEALHGDVHSAVARSMLGDL